MEEVEGSCFGCPVCGEGWVPVQDGGEMRTEYMDRHRREHEADIPARFFWDDKNNITVKNP